MLQLSLSTSSPSIRMTDAVPNGATAGAFSLALADAGDRPPDAVQTISDPTLRQIDAGGGKGLPPTPANAGLGWIADAAAVPVAATGSAASIGRSGTLVQTDKPVEADGSTPVPTSTADAADAGSIPRRAVRPTPQPRFASPRDMARRALTRSVALPVVPMSAAQPVTSSDVEPNAQADTLAAKMAPSTLAASPVLAPSVRAHGDTPSAKPIELAADPAPAPILSADSTAAAPNGRSPSSTRRWKKPDDASAATADVDVNPAPAIIVAPVPLPGDFPPAAPAPSTAMSRRAIDGDLQQRQPAKPAPARDAATTAEQEAPEPQPLAEQPATQLQSEFAHDAGLKPTMVADILPQPGGIRVPASAAPRSTSDARDDASIDQPMASQQLKRTPISKADRASIAQAPDPRSAAKFLRDPVATGAPFAWAPITEPTKSLKPTISAAGQAWRAAVAAEGQAPAARLRSNGAVPTDPPKVPVEIKPAPLDTSGAASPVPGKAASASAPFASMPSAPSALALPAAASGSIPIAGFQQTAVPSGEVSTARSTTQAPEAAPEPAAGGSHSRVATDAPPPALTPPVSPAVPIATDAGQAMTVAAQGRPATAPSVTLAPRVSPTVAVGVGAAATEAMPASAPTLLPASDQGQPAVVPGQPQPSALSPIRSAPGQTAAAVPVTSDQVAMAPASASASVERSQRPAALTPVVPVVSPSTPPVVAPAVIAFGAALATAFADRRASDAHRDPAEPLASAIAGLVQPHQPIAATADAVQQAPLDMHREDWPQAMIDRIEVLRDAADATDTHIRLMPDSLGRIDVSLHHDGDTVHVQFAAQAPATQAMLNVAQPKLAELAEARGLRLAQTLADGGAAGSDQQQQRGAAPQPTFSTRPASASRSATRAEADTRLA